MEHVNLSVDSTDFIESINTFLFDIKKKIKNGTYHGNPNLQDNVKLFDYQIYPAEYLVKTNSRGILLNFSVGTGKTKTAINITEQPAFRHRKVAVLSPSQTRTGFIRELISTVKDYALPTDHVKSKIREQILQKISERYTFVSSNSPYASSEFDEANQSIDVFFSQLINASATSGTYENPLSGKIIVIDEAHRVMSVIIGNSKNGVRFYNMLMNAKDCIIVMMTATPIINDPYELAVMFNILRGIMKWEIIKDVLVPAVISTGKKYITTSRDDDEGPSPDEDDGPDDEEELRGGKLIRRSTHTHMENEYTVFPSSYDRFTEIFVDYHTTPFSIKNKNIFIERIIGLVSYFQSEITPDEVSDFPTRLPTNIYYCRMSDWQWKNYKMFRARELEQERLASNRRIKVKHEFKKPYMSTATSFRVQSRIMSNFVFPPHVKLMDIDDFRRVDKKKQVKIVEQYIKELTSGDLKISDTSTECKKNIPEEHSSPLKVQVPIGTTGGTGTTLHGLGEYSTKIECILKNIINSTGLVFVYTTFVEQGGASVMKPAFIANGFKYVSSPTQLTEPGPPNKFVVFSGKSSRENIDNILEIFRDPRNAHGEYLRIVIATAVFSEGINLFNVRHIHILEPYWNYSRIKQIEGRCNRIKSHFSLPLDERNYQLNIYLSIPPEGETTQSLKKSEEKTTDVYLWERSLEHEKLINEFAKLLKISAFDCAVNYEKIVGIDKETYTCALCQPQLQYSSRKIFVPDIESHLLSDSTSCIPRGDGTTSGVKKIEKSSLVKLDEKTLMDKKTGRLYELIGNKKLKFIGMKKL